MVTITLDKERHLRLTLRGMREFQKQTGLDLLKGFSLSKMSFDDKCALMWACLIHEDKELSFDAFMDIVDISNILPFQEAITKSINESFPDRDDEPPLVTKPQAG